MESIIIELHYDYFISMYLLPYSIMNDNKNKNNNNNLKLFHCPGRFRCLATPAFDFNFLEFLTLGIFTIIFNNNDNNNNNHNNIVNLKK